MQRREFLKGVAQTGMSLGAAELLAGGRRAAAYEESPSVTAGIGQIGKGFATYPPLFAKQANTLDPVKMARESWKGYLTKQPDAWGMLPGLQPALRFHFDNRGLPWPNLKHHAVDGFDNNARNVGAHALLHAMLGEEKNSDPAEAGEIGYLLGITDPVSGFAYSPDVLPRECPLGEGEMARNLMLLFQQTGQKELWEWAERMSKTFRAYAVISQRQDVGPVAAYCQGGRGGQGGFIVGEPPVKVAKDPTLEGWQFLYVGWTLGAFSKWHELTGDPGALEFAVALANRLCHSEDAHGNDGCLRPDGSFGGNSQAAGGSFHMHGHTHCLPGLIHLGNQLIKAGQREKGLQMIQQARLTLDWLYDPSRNPDAGSQTGWLGEYLGVASGRAVKTDCEGCTMGDVVQTAVGLAAASRLDASLASLVGYYDRAEQIFTGQVAEQMFRPTKRYLEVVRECLEKRVAKEMQSASEEVREHEVERRYAEAVHTAERMVGQQMGLCGFPDWVNHLPSDLDAELPGIHMQGCCADATIRASHAIWSETVTGGEEEARVNLAFNRESPWVDVISCLPHRGEVNVVVKRTRRVIVRVPEWAPKSEVRAYRERQAVPVKWRDSYVVFEELKTGEHLTVTYPVRLLEVREKMQGVEYTERWRGNTIVDISPTGKWIPMYQRPELESEQVG
jgi:hypothetical protein